MTRQRIVSGDGDPRHGTMNGYHNLRCRCEICRAAWADYCRGRGDLAAYRDRLTKGRMCSITECNRRRDRAYPLSGFCHRHNIDFGVKAR
jgi:hypothetical protein